MAECKKKSMDQIYSQAACNASMASIRCEFLIQTLEARKKLLDAMSEYYDIMSSIERENAMFGFDLSKL